MYKKFSDYYDKLVFDIDYKKYSNNIVDLIENNNINNPSILEIGCGTGNVTKELSKNNSYNILAFDNSIEMLNHAYNKLIDKKNINLIKADMFDFDYKEYKHDVIFSLLDVINYILDKKDLIDLFNKIYNGLEYNGLFIFDLNSRYKLMDVLSNNTYVFEYEDIFYTWENTKEDNLVYFDLTFFVKSEDDKYERIEENQIERYYSIDEIIEILKEAGFKDISYTDEDGDEYIEDKTQRILFVAKK